MSVCLCVCVCCVCVCVFPYVLIKNYLYRPDCLAASLPACVPFEPAGWLAD